MKTELSESIAGVQKSFQEKNTVLKTIVFGIYNIAAFLWVMMLLSVYFLVANQRDRIAALRQVIKEKDLAYQFIDNSGNGAG